MRRLLAVALLVAGCGDDNKGQQDAARQIDAHLVDAISIDGPSVDAGPRGPNAFVMPGVSYGALWDGSGLYVTDDGGNRIAKWTDAASFTTYSALPTGAVANTLGSIVRASDGTMYTPTLGQPSTGTIYMVAPAAASDAALTGLDGTRRRIGLALDPSGLMYEAFFTGSGTMTPTGGLASVAIAAGVGTETTIPTTIALKKVTGLVATATDLYVCDQTAKIIYKQPLPTGTTTAFATVPSCDQMLVMPNGDFLTGGLTGGVYRVTSTGTVTSVVSGLDQIRGLAYDNTLHRLFVIEFRSTATTMPLLHVFPLDG